MAEIKDIVKITIAVLFFVFAGAMLAGFYFTVTSAPGQQALVGGMESVLESFFQFVAAPFQGLASSITHFFSSFGGLFHF